MRGALVGWVENFRSIHDPSVLASGALGKVYLGLAVLGCSYWRGIDRIHGEREKKKKGDGEEIIWRQSKM